MSFFNDKDGNLYHSSMNISSPKPSKLDTIIDKCVKHYLTEFDFPKAKTLSRDQAKSQILALLEEVIGPNSDVSRDPENRLKHRNELRTEMRLRKDAL